MIDRFRIIVAGIATLQPGDPALAASIHLAERTGAELHLVHAYPADHAEEGWHREAPVTRSALFTALLQSRLEELARAHATTDDVRCVVTPGNAADVLGTYARVVGADLLVLAPTQRAAGAVLGTTTSRLLRTSAAPVLVLRDRLAHRAARRVLLPTDLSEHSALALPIARELATALAAPETPALLPLFVQAPKVDTTAPPVVSARIGRAAAELSAFLDSVPAMEGEEGTVRVGSPAHEILAVMRQWDTDLVVLGTHGRPGLPRFFLGSVAETVLRKASCSALVIPTAAVRTHIPELRITALWTSILQPEPNSLAIF